MKRIEEIRLENFSDIEKMFDEVKSVAKAKNTDVYKRVLLVGEETIRKFEDVYGISFRPNNWEWADERYKNLKIKGSAKFVYVGEIQIYADCRDWQTEEYKRPRFNMGHIQKVVEYKNHLLTTGCSYRDKNYRFYLFNDDTDLSQVKVDKPNKVGTLTDKKADAWLNCLLDEKKRALETNNANIEKVKEFKNKLAYLTGRPLSDFSDNIGTISLGIFRVIYKCEPKTGYTHFGIDFNNFAKAKDGHYLNDEDRLRILYNAGLLK